MQIVVFNTKSSNQDSRESWRDSGDSSNSSANRDSSNLRESGDSSNSSANLDSSDSRESPQISAFYGLCIMIYAVFEVLFSIWRKKFVRKTSAMQPDGIHFHMLIFKRLTRNNPKTALFILALNILPIACGTIFYGNLITLIATLGAFVALYLSLYFRLIRFKKPRF